ncbi:MAG: hypothetical protein QM713_13005 [Arachnia sp.]
MSRVAVSVHAVNTTDPAALDVSSTVPVADPEPIPLTQSVTLTDGSRVVPTSATHGEG